MTETFNISVEQLELAKKGDLKATSLLITTFEKAIFNHLYRLTGDKEDAADLTQDTFVKVYKKRHLIDPKQNIKSWIYKIATNTAYDWFSKNKSKNDISLSEDDNLETIALNLPYYRIEQAEKMDLEAALDKLQPKYQNIIFLHYQQGFTYEEIAEIMHVPLGTVKTLLYRAKKALAEELK